MFLTLVLKKILPFTLTLALGSLFGGAFELFGARSDAGAKWRGRADARRSYSGCRSGRGRRAVHAQSTPVVYTYEPNTHYTEEAMRRGVTGVVRLRVTFGASGRIERVEPVLRLPHGLTEEAERVAWQTRFTPATDNGVPVTVAKEVDYVFSLSDRMKAGL